VRSHFRLLPCLGVRWTRMRAAFPLGHQLLPSWPVLAWNLDLRGVVVGRVHHPRRSLFRAEGIRWGGARTVACSRLLPRIFMRMRMRRRPSLYLSSFCDCRHLDVLLLLLLPCRPSLKSAYFGQTSIAAQRGLVQPLYLRLFSSLSFCAQNLRGGGVERASSAESPRGSAVQESPID